MYSSITTLSDQIKALQNGDIWIYFTFDKQLADLKEEQAVKRPKPDVHAVIEIVAHLIHWRLKASRNLLPDLALGFYEEDWQSIEKLKDRGWKQVLIDFEQSLSPLLNFMQDKTDDLLEGLYFDQDHQKEFSRRFLIEGIIQHDLYHLGQLGLIIRMLKE